MADPSKKALACPICKAPSADAYKPFCSKRCADIDLGRWFTGGYAIPTAPDDTDATDAPRSVPRPLGEDEEN